MTVIWFKVKTTAGKSFDDTLTEKKIVCVSLRFFFNLCFNEKLEFSLHDILTKQTNKQKNKCDQTKC